MRHMYDAAYPPGSPPHLDAVAGYIGGDTPHVWTDAEWNAQPARWRLPIFVRSDPASASVGSDAATAVDWLRAHNAPKGSLVALDLETAVDAAYVRAFDAVLVHAGYKVVEYGSASTIFSDPATSGGRWVALWNNDDTSLAGGQIHQYIDRGSYDESVVADDAPLWDTHPTPAPPPQEDDEMFGELKDGNTEPTILTWPAGKCSAVGFGCDNGQQNLPPAKIRVAAHSRTGGWDQIVDEVVDSTKGKTVLVFSAKDVDIVSVTRLDAGNVAVGWDAS